MQDRPQPLLHSIAKEDISKCQVVEAGPIEGGGGLGKIQQHFFRV